MSYLFTSESVSEGHPDIMMAGKKVVVAGYGDVGKETVASFSGAGAIVTVSEIELWKNFNNYEKKVYMLPKHLDEKVTRLHLKKLGVEIEELNENQAKYIGVNVEGPFKPDY
tara:strand:+ start:757 stop:1092 length:336 start_codon:yes stop_codon:yes gene_type:complete